METIFSVPIILKNEVFRVIMVKIMGGIYGRIYKKLSFDRRHADMRHVSRNGCGVEISSVWGYWASRFSCGLFRLDVVYPQILFCQKEFSCRARWADLLGERIRIDRYLLRDRVRFFLSLNI
jgi:hypothetical protein